MRTIKDHKNDLYLTMVSAISVAYALLGIGGLV